MEKTDSFNNQTSNQEMAQDDASTSSAHNSFILPNEDGHRNNQHRLSFAPLDDYCKDSQWIINNMKQVDLTFLERGSDDLLKDLSAQLHKTLIVGQLLWIVTPSKDESSRTYSYSNKRFSKTNLSSGGLYNRILFFRECSEQGSSEDNRIFCMVQLNNVKNTALFNRFPTERDNGMFTIGSLIGVVNPEPIDEYMIDIPMIVSHDKAILLKPFPIRSSIPLLKLKANETKAFVYCGSDIICRFVTFMDSPCSGRFCDRQNIEAIMSKGKSCGCFSHKSNRSNIISVHQIVYTDFSDKIELMKNFSSLQFMEMYTKGKLSIDVRASRFQPGHPDCGIHYDRIFAAIEDITQLVNDDGGWVLFGWTKQGLIKADDNNRILGNDFRQQDPPQGQLKCLSEDTIKHIVHVVPVERDYLDKTTVRGKKLDDLKFDFSSI